MQRFLPYSRQYIDKKDIKRVSETLKEDYITQGPKIASFEKKFAQYVGSKFAVACATGTAALHLSCQALGLKPGENLLTTPITFVASANCAQYVGANTFFADIEPNNYCVSPKSLEKQLKKRKIDVLVVVHMSGHPANMHEIYKLKRKYKFKLIEDACHALGGSYRKKKIGSCFYSDISTFSFHPVKTITCGEGGMITTNSRKLYEKLLKYRTHGIHKISKDFINQDLAFDKDGRTNVWYYEMNNLGYNYRITDIQCALGESQLKKVEKFIRTRRKIAKIYNKAFKSNKLITTPFEDKNNVIHTYHLYTILVDFKKLGKSRNQVMNELRKFNIGTQVLYIPVHFHPYYANKYGYAPGDFPNSENYYKKCLSIPIFPGIKNSEINYVINKVNSIIS